MRKTLALLLAATFAAALQATPASAQPTRTWVSGTGNDAGNCPRQAPCKTFAWAHNQVFAGGEITVLDPSGYGSVTITKAVSIVSDGGSGEASVATFAGSAITINAGPGDVVILRGLVIDGLNGATGGIQFNTGAALHIQNSFIKNVRGASGTGINFTPSASSDLYVTDTTIVNNGTGLSGGGIAVRPTGAGLVRATFSRVTVEQNATGITIDGAASTGAIRATVRDSVISTNTGTGLWANAPAGAQTGVYFINSSSVQNGTVGIYANGANARITLMGSSVMGNQTGISSPGGNVYTYKNNAINFNFGSDGAIPPANILPLN